MRVVEHGAAVVVDEAFRKRPLGDDHVVRLELDMDIFDRFDPLGLDDGDAVDQILGLDQHAVEIHGVIGRDPQIARRHVLAERA